MKIIYIPNATAGQIANDLELIAQQHPGAHLEFSNEAGFDLFVEGIKLRKEAAILETTGKAGRAATAADLLEMFRMLPPSLYVVLQSGWKVLDIEPNGDGRIFWYDDEDDFVRFEPGDDVRLLSTEHIIKAMDKHGIEEFLGCKVVVADRQRREKYHVNDVVWKMGKLCLLNNKDVESDYMTVETFLSELSVCSQFMIRVRGKYHTVDKGEEPSFSFATSKNGEKSLFVFLGEVVYDPADDWV